MCFYGLIRLDELQIAIGLGWIEESRGWFRNRTRAFLSLSFLGGSVGCRRAGVHAWLATHFVLPVDRVLDTHGFHFLIFFWRHFRVFPVWKVSLFDLRLVFWDDGGRFYRRFACASLGAVALCWQGRLLSGFHFDTTSPLRFVLPSTIFYLFLVVLLLADTRIVSC